MGSAGGEPTLLYTNRPLLEARLSCGGYPGEGWRLAKMANGDATTIHPVELNHPMWHRASHCVCIADHGIGPLDHEANGSFSLSTPVKSTLMRGHEFAAGEKSISQMESCVLQCPSLLESSSSLRSGEDNLSSRPMAPLHGGRLSSVKGLTAFSCLGAGRGELGTGRGPGEGWREQ